MSLVEKALRKMHEARTQEPIRPDVAPETAARSESPAAGSAAHTQPSLTDTAPWQPSKYVQINRVALRAVGLLPPEHQERELADQYRQIKRPLIANALGRGVPRLPDGHLVMMASATPGEGKTFTSINLALSMALEKDISVLLVDADVAKPHISRLFGVEREPGLLDVLQDESLDVESLIIGTDVPGLNLLPAGRPAETATELLASARMQEIVSRIGARDANRIVLFDSPPLLLTSESRELANVVGQIVLVVAAGRASHQEVLEALGYLSEGKSISLILNQRRGLSASGYYYGQGGYGVSSRQDESMPASLP